MSDNTKKAVNWSNSIFMVSTLLVTLTAVPYYVWNHGVDLFQGVLFFLYYIATGLSITLGYHRLFSHRAFKAKWPVKFSTLVFGAAAFENSALNWADDHRRHHKFVDHDEDPYDATKGFFHSHIGWILFDSGPDKFEHVGDLKKDRLVMWQHDNYLSIAVFAGLLLPALIGLAWGGWMCALGSFLLAGVARVVTVHHFTFLINSLCHMLGSQPYSTKNTARDSAITAVLTFGEGYHNFHHTFQHDYRNGIKPWHFDPTKWTVAVLNKLGLVDSLRRVPDEKIMQARIAEQQRRLALKIDSKPMAIAEPIMARIHAAQEKLETTYQNWEKLEAEYTRAVEKKWEESKEKFAEVQQEFNEAREHFRQAIKEWQETHQLALAQFA